MMRRAKHLAYLADILSPLLRGSRAGAIAWHYFQFDLQSRHSRHKREENRETLADQVKFAGGVESVKVGVKTRCEKGV
jgi:hypothetical protein